MGRRRKGPTWDGVLVVDKPAGPTSHDVVQQVRRAAGQGRVGHTGTLDPAATGVLVCCLGRATRLVQFLQAGTKTYHAELVLGVETDTQDADGEVVASADASGVDEAGLCAALADLRGEIEQLPPMASAVRVGGRRLHEAARAGEEVEREPRQVTVHDLVLESFEPGERARASLLVTCSPGTYVRTLAHDLGRALGVGGSLTALRRLANGPFDLAAAHTVEEIEAAGEARGVRELTLSPLEAVTRALPSAEIDDPDAARRLAQGQALPVELPAERAALVHRGRLLGIYRADDGRARTELGWTRPEELADGAGDEDRDGRSP